MDPFAEIRPYQDDEVRPVLDRLLTDNHFLDLMGRFRVPRLSRWFPFLIRPLVRHRMAREIRDVHCVDDLQQVIARYVDHAVEHTTSGLTHSGLEQLSPNRAYLFVSNHRDIVFDPTVVNYMLWHNGFGTSRIAIGDNLLKNPLFAEMMRLNKSFVVKRNLTSPREMRDVYSTLSAFVNHSIEEGHSIWIAQREGRAKDGIDATDPAIIKMFYMSQKTSGDAFQDVIRRLSIVPVSIAYEYDPCDIAKAWELEERGRTGAYVKTDTEDSEHIIRGITGFKGRVHVGFGAPLTGEYENAKAVAQAIDTAILDAYKLFPTHHLAYERLREIQPEKGYPVLSWDENQAGVEPARRWLEGHLAQCPEALHPYLLGMYANPVIRKYGIEVAETQ
ncbi:1-acyl-sn-glycerol-3-phosphate acyltransferase [Mangrovitalea sediminis]|uniref:1-acyl-sn-glycerol-3-phosphate acyltransferase n=1 Tax=Mangrovitalea sediminis TaxID=1982043 RepID=UPI000BE4E095|nr:1-acyl-sn-glycerol-3-phosphate acyltransferase [Mangrovitalea sediminis]